MTLHRERTGQRDRTGRHATAAALILPAVLLPTLLAGTAAADLAAAANALRIGRYAEAVTLAADDIGTVWRGERAALLKMRAELALGRYDDAGRSLDEGLRVAPSSLPLRLLGREVRRFNGRDDAAAALLGEMEQLIRTVPQRYATPEGRVAVGRFLRLRGADARIVLDQFFDVARKADPQLADAYYATAELALDKQDDKLAADTLRAAPQTLAADPRYHVLLARAYAEGDRAASEAATEAALAITPHDADALLLQADRRIDGERYDEAAELIDNVLKVNPHEPRAWAYRAVLGHLNNDAAAETAAHGKALAHWATNPEVDHLIGRKLSQKYRFVEGSAYQRRSLKIDPDYRPAKLQLAQDLLRLGEEEAGWKLADEVAAADGYNVVGYNLTTLRDHLAGFRTLRGDGFIVRMDAREAELYGDRVLALLDEARLTLCAKYGIDLPGPTVVEIFPKKNDFAVRTFGLPGADGFLGVCFGPVITVNSPASQGAKPSNWEAVLWHEFCHTVTLAKTRNTMPRWLSEGISVYEEGQRNPAWGMSLLPAYRARIENDGLTPLSQLSSAFLTAQSPADLQFAYYESSLAVEFLVDRFGMPTLEWLLDDLGAGLRINDSLTARTGSSLDDLDAKFAEFARDKAAASAPGATWEEPDLSPTADAAALSAWLKTHPQNVPGLKRLAAKLIAENKWEDAKTTLETLRPLVPDDAGPDSVYRSLAVVQRNLGDVAAERAALAELVRLDGDATDAFARLAELDEAAGDWPAVAADARRLLAVNPLIPSPHRLLARAAERTGDPAAAVAAYRAVAVLDDTDPADLHFRIASLLRQVGKNDEARREVLKSLEEAPRFLAAHELLLELVSDARTPDLPVEAPKP